MGIRTGQLVDVLQLGDSAAAAEHEFGDAVTTPSATAMCAQYLRYAVVVVLHGNDHVAT